MTKLLGLPNLLTLARLLSVPFIIWLSYGKGPGTLLAAMGLMAAAAVSDAVDGYIARTRGLTTKLGTYLDQVVDKVLVLSVFFVMADRGVIPMWLVLVNMFREFLVSDFRRFSQAHERTVGADWRGKVKFCLQVALVFAMYAYLVAEAAGVHVAAGRRVVFWAAVGVTAVSIGFAVATFWGGCGGLFEED